MNSISPYLIGIGLTLVTAELVLLYLRRHLRAILTELCGAPERARFWVAFSNVTLLFVPLIFAMSYEPEARTYPVVLQVMGQLKLALIGLVAALVVLGLILKGFIRRREAGVPTAGTAPRAS